MFPVPCRTYAFTPENRMQGEILAPTRLTEGKPIAGHQMERR